MYERILELCDLYNTNIASLEKELGFGSSTIIKWKSAVPRADKLLMVARKFHVSMEYLLTGDGKEESDENLKFALFGGAETVSDEMYAEVKRFARFIKTQRRNEE